MKKSVFVPIVIISVLVYVQGYAQQLLYQNFDSFSNGTLSGQGTWVTENSNSIQIDVNNTNPIAGCFGGGGRYITPQTVATFTTERVYFPTTNWVANTDQSFYLSFLINLSNAGSDNNAHIVSLGNDFGGTKYEFSRIHARASGSGFNIGISEGGGTSLGAVSAGINWGADVYSLNETYFVVLRYDYFNIGGANADMIHVWVNPSVVNGSEPTTSSAAAVIAPGTLGNDILFPGDNVRNVYINNGANGPAYRIDEIRYARGGSSASAWSSLGISGSCPSTLPVVLSNFTTKADGNYAFLQWQTVAETNNKGFVIYRSGDDGNSVKIGEVDGKGTASAYSFTDKAPLNGNNYYKLVQVDKDGKTAELGVKAVTFSFAQPQLNVFPNPVTNMLTVNFETGYFNVAELIELNGKVLKAVKLKLTDTQCSFDLSDLPTGIYFVRLVGDSKVAYEKVIKK